MLVLGRFMWISGRIRPIPLYNEEDSQKRLRLRNGAAGDEAAKQPEYHVMACEHGWRINYSSRNFR
jgi:hypothetical protein